MRGVKRVFRISVEFFFIIFDIRVILVSQRINK